MDILTRLDTTKYLDMLKYRDINLMNFDNLYYSILMCENGNNKFACMDYYRILSGEVNPRDLNFNPIIYKKLSSYFLIKAYLLGEKSAKYKYERNFSDGIPDSVFTIDLRTDFISK